MPKVSWNRPRVNHLAALLKTYKQAEHMTYEQLGKLVGCSAQNCVQQIAKPADMWTIKQIKLYCSALDVPVEDAVLAAVQK